MEMDHQAELEAMVQNFDYKTKIENGRYNALKEIKAQSIGDYNGQCVLIEKRHHELIDKRENDHIRALNEKRDLLVSLEKQKQALKEQFELRRGEQEEGSERDL